PKPKAHAGTSSPGARTMARGLGRARGGGAARAGRAREGRKLKERASPRTRRRHDPRDPGFVGFGAAPRAASSSNP
ncbi:MAG: hypothetical protein ACYC41_13700, partial [Bacillota bacterium]